MTSRDHAPPSLRVLIVDDHAGLRARARALTKAAGYDVVGEAGTAAAAITEARRLAPDAILLDVQLPGRDGFAVAAEICAQPEAPSVVLISSRRAADYGSQLNQTRASGFIHKPDLSRSTLGALLGAPEASR